MESAHVIIIGGGIAGLTAAHGLSKAGIDVLVLEQAPHVGGRLSTFRQDAAVFDTGAQYFTVRRPEFQQIAEFWLATGTAREWTRAFPDTSGVAELSSHPRYCGTSGMQSLAVALAKNLRVQTSACVKRLQEGRACWIVELEDRRRIRADIVVLTPPLPVSLRLISDENTWRMGALLLPLTGITYKPGVSVTALLDGPSGLQAPGALRVDHDMVSWIADNRIKGISPNADAVTIHGTQAFSDMCFGKDPEETSAQLARSAAAFLKSRICSHKVHVWPHGTPSSTLLSSYHLVDGRAPLFFAGDAFAGGRIEGAAVSGIETARSIIERANKKTG